MSVDLLRDPRSHFFGRLVTLARHAASSAWPRSRFNGDRTPARDDFLINLEIANRQVMESERIVADWSALIATKRAQGEDVARGVDLLESFKSNLETHRSTRDRFQQLAAHSRIVKSHGEVGQD